MMGHYTLSAGFLVCHLGAMSATVKRWFAVFLDVITWRHGKPKWRLNCQVHGPRGTGQ